MLRRYLLLWLCVTSWIAYVWSLPFDPFVLGKFTLPWVIAVTMFCLGLLLPEDEVRQLLRRWPLVIAGTTVQYIAMPLLAWTIASLFPLTPELRLGLVMVGCVPGAMASNVLTLMAGGNVSYSLSLTTMATCLSPVAVPLTLKLMLNEQLTTSLVGLVWELCWMVLIPVVVGYLVSMGRSWKPRVRWLGELVAAAAILWIIAVVVGLNRDRLADSPPLLLVAALLLNLGGYASGLLAATVLRLDESMKRALVLEIGMQNAGLGTTLALVLFADRPEVMIPTAVYTFGCVLTGGLLARFWGTRGCEAEGGRGSI